MGSFAVIVSYSDLVEDGSSKRSGELSQELGRRSGHFLTEELNLEDMANQALYAWTSQASVDAYLQFDIYTRTTFLINNLCIYRF